MVKTQLQRKAKPRSPNLMLQGEEEEELVGQKLIILQPNCKLISFIFNSFRSKRYHERMKAKNQKAEQDIVHHDDLKIPKLSPLKANLQMKCNYFFADNQLKLGNC